MRVREIVAEWVRALEHEPDFWGLRVFAPDGGYIWRNAAARQYYERHGFFAAPTMAWARVKKYLSRPEQITLHQVYTAAFLLEKPILHQVTGHAPGHAPSTTLTIFTAVHGNLQEGIIITHLRPLPCRLPQHRPTSAPQQSPLVAA
jgi:hypothetical protein